MFQWERGFKLNYILYTYGLINNEISKKLSISEPTVKTHLRNIYSKTDIHDRASLAICVLNSDKD